jgi:hypothetical protein
MNKVDINGYYTCEYCEDEYNDYIGPSSIEHDGMLICYDCYEHEYCDRCIICEEYFHETKCPEDTYLLVPASKSDDLDLEPGFYQINKNNVKLVKKFDIEKHEKWDDIAGSYICKDCFYKYCFPFRFKVRKFLKRVYYNWFSRKMDIINFLNFFKFKFLLTFKCHYCGYESLSGYRRGYVLFCSRCRNRFFFSCDNKVLAVVD